MFPSGTASWAGVLTVFGDGLSRFEATVTRQPEVNNLERTVAGRRRDLYS